MVNLIMNKKLFFYFKVFFPVLIILSVLSCTGKKSEAVPEVKTALSESESESIIDPGEKLFNLYREKIINYPPKGDDFPYAFKGLKDVHIASALTGEYSINKTFSNYNVFGTDLGIIFNQDDKVYIAFGDTFSKPKFGGIWRSNVLAFTRDHDAGDGILFNGMITNEKQNTAIEILHSAKQDNN